MLDNETNVCGSGVYEKVFHEHSQNLRNYLYYKYGNLQKAEDIVQDSYIKLWNNCSKVLLPKAKSYLYTIANNAFLNDIAHQKVRLNYQNYSHQKFSIETPEFKMEEKEFMTKLNNAIADLREGQREVFLLNRIEKKKYKEIAEILGISVKAVEKRMHQALIVLRQKIGKI